MNLINQTVLQTRTHKCCDYTHKHTNTHTHTHTHTPIDDPCRHPGFPSLRQATVSGCTPFATIARYQNMLSKAMFASLMSPILIPVAAPSRTNSTFNSYLSTCSWKIDTNSSVRYSQLLLILDLSHGLSEVGTLKQSAIFKRVLRWNAGLRLGSNRYSRI
jgi:hypothetical protein